MLYGKNEFLYAKEIVLLSENFSLIAFSATIGTSAKYLEVDGGRFETQPHAEVTVHCAYDPLVHLQTKRKLHSAQLTSVGATEKKPEKEPEEETDIIDED